MTATYTTAEAAARLGLNKKMIQQYAREGTIAAVVIDGRYQITGPALAAFLRNRGARRTRCRNGHDLTHPNAVYIRQRTGIRRCRACLAQASRRRWLKVTGRASDLMLADRHPDLFQRLADETRDMSPYKRLAAALCFWEAA